MITLLPSAEKQKLAFRSHIHIADIDSLLMEEIPNNHLGCIDPFKHWHKLPTSTGEFPHFFRQRYLAKSRHHFPVIFPKGIEVDPEQSCGSELKSPKILRFPSSKRSYIPRLPFFVPLKLKHLFKMLNELGCKLDVERSFVVLEPKTYAYSLWISYTAYIILLILLIHSFSKYARISPAFKTWCFEFMLLSSSYSTATYLWNCRTFILWIHVRKPCKVRKRLNEKWRMEWMEEIWCHVEMCFAF